MPAARTAGGTASRPAAGRPGAVRLLGLIDLAAGCWLLAAPFVLSYPTTYPHFQALLNDITVGVLVVLLTVVHMLSWNTLRTAARGVLLLGLWLLVAPVAFNYHEVSSVGYPPLVNDLVTGVVLLAGSGLSLAASSDPEAQRSR